MQGMDWQQLLALAAFNQQNQQPQQMPQMQAPQGSPFASPQVNFGKFGQAMGSKLGGMGQGASTLGPWQTTVIPG